MRLAPCCFTRSDENYDDDDDPLTIAIQASPFYEIYSEKLIEKDKGAFYVYRDKYSTPKAVSLVKTTYEADEAVINLLNRIYDAEINTAPLDVYFKGGNSLFDKLNAFDYNDIKKFISIASKQDEEFFDILKNCDSKLDDIIHFTIIQGNEFISELDIYWSKNGYQGVEILIKRLKSVNLFLYSDYSDDEFKNNVALFKEKLPKWAQNQPNYAYCKVEVDGISKKDYFAHSAIHDEKESVKNSGISVLPEKSVFHIHNVNPENIIDGFKSYDRIYDTENKILCEIVDTLGNRYNVSGEITLYTYYKPCISCDSIFSQFKEMYPNIIINVVYEEYY